MSGILIVEDDNDLRDMLKTALIRSNFTVFEAGNGKDAIVHFKPGVTDVVITDLIMPEEDGLKVIMKIREIKPDIKVVAISGGGKAGPANYLDMAKALGADSVFYKPFSLNDLVGEIKNLLGTEHSGRL